MFIPQKNILSWSGVALAIEEKELIIIDNVQITGNSKTLRQRETISLLIVLLSQIFR